MKKTVNFCGNCPFKISEYDDWSMGDSFTYKCNLAMFQQKEEYFLRLNKSKDELINPDWCPLKIEEITFNFKEFSIERKQEIDSAKKEIDVLQDYFDNGHDIDYDDPEVIEKNDKLQELYTKLGELQSNEEPSEEDELIKNIDIIKEQLHSLEDASIKLQESLGKLSEDENS